MVVLGQTKVHVAWTLSPAVPRRWFLRKSKNNSWHVNNNSYKLKKWEYLKSRLVWTCEGESKKESGEKPLYIRLLLSYCSHGVICSTINFRACVGGVLNCYIQAHGGSVFSLPKEYLFSPSIFILHFIILVLIKASNSAVIERFNSQLTKASLLLAKSRCRKVSRAW